MAGLAASGINYLISYAWGTFYADALKTKTLFFILPFTGLALSYFLVHLLAWYRMPKSSFHTILESFHLTQSGMTMREAVVKAGSSVATVIFGGSAGPEGPITILSGGFSVWLSKVTKVGFQARKALMIGVAAGFSASFKTPLAGLLFALELPYKRDLENDPFVEAAIAASTGYLVSVALDTPSLLPNLSLDVGSVPVFMLPVAMLFGLATGGVVFLFTRLYRVGEDMAKMLNARGGYPLMLISGGLLLGAVGFLCPVAVGPGFQMIPLLGGGTLSIILAVILLRSMATTFTLTLGGTGGLFLPTLMIGGAWGAAVGSLLMPSMAPVFVLMGMAGFSAGVHKMMITTIVFLAELFGAHAVIPIILATVVAFFVSSADSFYPFQPLNKAYKEELALERFYYKVSRKWRRELEKLGAKDVMTPNPIGLKPDMSVLQAFEEFSKTSFRTMPVVDESNVLLGYVTLEDLASLSKTALASPLHSTGLHSPLTFKEDENVVKVIEDMIEGKVDHAFVTDEENRLRGIISGIDVVRLLLRYYTHP